MHHIASIVSVKRIGPVSIAMSHPVVHVPKVENVLVRSVSVLLVAWAVNAGRRLIRVVMSHVNMMGYAVHGMNDNTRSSSAHVAVVITELIVNTLTPILTFTFQILSIPIVVHCRPLFLFISSN